MFQSSRYTVTYFPVPMFGDLTRLILDVSGTNYENNLIDAFKDWPTFKDTTAWGKVPKLTIHCADGSTKDLYESSAIEAYLADVLDLLPGPDAFARAECFSVVSSLNEIDETVRAIGTMPTVELRKERHLQHIAETIPAFMRYHEHWIASRGGPYYFGNRLTLPDLKLYALYLKYDHMYGESNPFKALAGEYPKIAKIIENLDTGHGGDYARNRRQFGGPIKWVSEDWNFGFKP